MKGWQIIPEVLIFYLVHNSNFVELSLVMSIGKPRRVEGAEDEENS